MAKTELSKDEKNEIERLNNLSEEIRNHGNALTELKNKYQKQCAESKKSAEGLKKNLAETKKSLEELQELVDDFYTQLAGRKLDISRCPGLEELRKQIKTHLEIIQNLESRRIKNKYGIENTYSGKYLTVSKNNSARGITCQSACNEIEETINGLHEGILGVARAQKISKKYEKILEVSQEGLNKTKRNSSEVDDSIEEYTKIKIQLNQQVNNIKSSIANGQKQLEEIKRKAPSDDGVIAAIESWVKSLSTKDVLTVAKMAAAACAAPVAQYAYHWVVDQYFAGQ